MESYTRNANRFLGFAQIYDNARPRMPRYAVETICRYLGGTPERVVDLGCGTGLSTAAWKGCCGQIVGIEPSEDMLAVARQKADDSISFQKAYAHATGLPSQFAQIVVCSQSFHWMDPVLTLDEVNRILQPGGVFATVDCDWPPVCNWQAEQAYNALLEKVRTLESDHPKLRHTFVRWNKDAHLENIQNSGYFRYSREIVFSNREDCDVTRFIALAYSQGGLQGILKREPALVETDVQAFEKCVHTCLPNGIFQVDFCYRMRVGVK